jgi:hypothetical protein
LLLTSAAVAHHGWGSYDANKPLTISGPILSSKFENPHATITVRSSDKVWTVTLAPTSRMSTRGATEKVVAVGQDVSAYGYPSTVEKDEMRAERITVNGKTYEPRRPRRFSLRWDWKSLPSLRSLPPSPFSSNAHPHPANTADQKSSLPAPHCGDSPRRCCEIRLPL